MLRQVTQGRAAMVGADKAYDEAGLVAQLRALQITPHVAQYEGRQQYRWAHDAPCWLSDQPAKAQKHRANLRLIKNTALMRKVRHRGRALVRWQFTLALSAYNLVRMRTLALAANKPAEVCPLDGQSFPHLIESAWDKALVPDQKLMLATFYSRKSLPMHFSSPSLACVSPQSEYF